MNKVNLIPNSVKLTLDQQRAVSEYAAKENRKIGAMLRILIDEALRARHIVTVTVVGKLNNHTNLDGIQ